MPCLKFGKDFDNSKVFEDLKNLMTRDEKKYKELSTIKFGNFGEFQEDVMSYLEHLDFFCEYTPYDVYKDKDCTDADEYIEMLKGKFEVIEREFSVENYINLYLNSEEYANYIKENGAFWLAPILKILDVKVYEVKEIREWFVVVNVKGYENKMLVVLDDAYCDHDISIHYIYDPQGDCMAFWFKKDIGEYSIEFDLTVDPKHGVTVIGGNGDYSVNSTSDTVEGAIEDIKKYEKVRGN